MSLTDKKCVPCEGGISPFQDKEITEYMKEVSGWETDNQKIWKDYSFKNFKEALAFVNKVGELAESEGHHPDITFGWGKVHIELTTHAIKGLSENDFIVAAKIDELK